MEWIICAFGSALFAGLTAILSKCGVKCTDSDVATALRTGVVLIFAWLMVVISGTQTGLDEVGLKTWIFLLLSGLATGASWLCYFRALQLGDVNKVTPIDKSSTVLTMILAIIFLHESITLLKIAAMILIGVGTFFMIEKKDIGTQAEKSKSSWLIYACGSAVFASITSILGKIGIENVDSNLGTAIRTIVVFLMAWGIVFATKKQKLISNIDRNSWIFLVLSGVATGASWLCYYHALQTGLASVVVPIDKLSIVVTILFSYFVFHEKLTKKAAAGFIGIIAGTMLLLL